MNNTVKELEKRRKKYAKEWIIDANNFYNNNYYKWMENLIKDYKRVIEIGCGNGNSTLELCNAGHTVISIDENIECLKLAKEKLESSGYKVLFIKRESLLVKSEKNT
ncbi:class I SAM-dependent methyltransferase [Clostridium magnum]|uniref:Bifunctional 3-demethylubiquinone-9 3-methyltransferase/ 2-octaprenyl-6-hydroxy phenol methylase n=1 Tax=Clostridium magnum DSM 2767 TaxID=1121326 RepID=A0A162QP73_9CLOT|nr:class I SAM-dependent methyltransferase [Clostridium magnum]KZL88779.1 bifunctional 3-demethylubiquinone-9 3-methyltransferase/ 2-octaprenyl-6-hydroxy phenol methylase [Clostridium magnum DSM 2767]SHJ57593.1 Methyltransferase domain-containing protein [Clostridium magnum DSM 2767]